MFSHIKTSKENKEVVTQLTNKLSLGAENVIARIAIAHSLAQEDSSIIAVSEILYLQWLLVPPVKNGSNGQ